MPHPNFLVIGAAKCGTTSLYQYLKSHPEVFLPDFKEPTFFAPARAALIKTEAEYLRLFEHAGHARAVGEASVGYIYYPESPGLIRGYLGSEVRLIALVRNPVDMLYSAWAHRVHHGDELRPAREALLSSFDGPYADLPAYSALADYATQLRRYYALFPRENIRVLVFEEFFKPGLPQLAGLCRFLGVSDAHSPRAEVHNKGILTPRSRKVQRFLSSYYGRFVAPLACRLVPAGARHAVRRRIERWNAEGGTAIPPLETSLRRELTRRMAPTVGELEQLLGRDLSQVWPDNL